MLFAHPPFFRTKFESTALTQKETKTAVVMALSLAYGHVASKMHLPTDGDRTTEIPCGLPVCQAERWH